MTAKPVKAPSNNPFTFSLETPSLSSGTLDKYLKSVLGEDSNQAIPELFTKANQLEALRKEAAENSLQNQSQTTNIPEVEKNIQPSLNAPPVNIAPITTSTTPSNLSSMMGSQPSMSSMNLQMGSFGVSSMQNLQSMPPSSQQEMSMPTNQLATTGSDNNELIPVPRGQNYVDITEYLNMPQAEAAKKLGIPPSTLSKRWKEAVRKRKWPYRMICKIDKEIMTLLHNVPQGPNAPPLPEEIETALGISLRKRQEELRPVVIRI